MQKTLDDIVNDGLIQKAENGFGGGKGLGKNCFQISSSKPFGGDIILGSLQWYAP